MTDLTLSGAKPLIPVLAPAQRALAPLVEPALRVAAGLLLVPHGAQKLFGAFGGYGLEATGQWFQSIGYPASAALAVGLIEFVGGLLLAAGLLTRIAAGFIAGFLFVAVLQHAGAGFFWNEGGFEYPLLWGLLALGFVIRGGGKYSVDRLVGREI
jgi:putative oxidoreductase